MRTRSAFLWFALASLIVAAAVPGCGSSAGVNPAPPTAAARPAASPSTAGVPAAEPPAGASAEPAAPDSAGPGTTKPPPEAADSLPNLWTRKKGVDWPWFLGPTRDSRSSETGLLSPWPQDGPRIVWQRPLGEGYGIGSISRGRLLQFDRQQDQAVLVCLNAETGEQLWKFSYPTDYADLYSYNGGPRASPVIDGDRVYILGAEGLLHCLQLADGQPVWKFDTSRKFGVVQNFFGVGSTPVVEGELLLVMVGGSPPEDQAVAPGQLDRVSGNGSGVVAFDKLTGEVRYQITDELASYASLQVATIGGRRWAFAFCRGGLVAFEPATGKVDFQYPWRARLLESVNASTPVVVGDKVFISETYGIGSSLLKVVPGGQEVVWSDDPNRREKSFKAHWNTPVFVDGHLYGCSGRNPPDAELRCIEWETGKVKWSIPNRIRTSLLYVDGHLVSLGEYGALELIKVNPEKYDVVSEVTLRRSETGPAPPGLEATSLLRYPCWAAPILSHGLLYVRGDDRLVCLELIPE